MKSIIESISDLSVEDWLKIYEELDSDKHLSIAGQVQLDKLRFWKGIPMKGNKWCIDK